LWRFVKSFVAAARLHSYSQQNDDEMTDDEEGKDESNDENDTGWGREEKQQDEQDNEEKDAVDDEFLMYMIDIDWLLDDDPDYIDEVVHHLLGVEYSDEQVMSVLRTLGAMTSAAQTANWASLANRKKLEAWLNLPALLCPVYFQTAAKLKAFVKLLLPVCTLPANASELVARNALTEHLTLYPATIINDVGESVQDTASISSAMIIMWAKKS
jgi:hypothetical protein